MCETTRAPNSGCGSYMVPRKVVTVKCDLCCRSNIRETPHSTNCVSISTCHDCHFNLTTTARPVCNPFTSYEPLTLTIVPLPGCAGFRPASRSESARRESRTHTIHNSEMATFDETFNPAALARSDTVTSTTGNSKAPPGSASKSSKTSQSYPRVDLEPLYAELKSLIAHHWETYYDALTRFIRGIQSRIYPAF